MFEKIYRVEEGLPLGCASEKTEKKTTLRRCN